MNKENIDNYYWNERAKSHNDDFSLNIMDLNQRNLEYDFIISHLKDNMDVLEVGCGNGYSASLFRDKVSSIDSFDYSEHMINRALQSYGEKNNKFFVDDVLKPEKIVKQYDMVICVRVLINLKNLNQQKIALKNIHKFIKPGGKAIIVEGFTEGFVSISNLRIKLGMTKIEPAKINFYSKFSDVKPTLDSLFEVLDKFHLGSYDFLTRVVYPLLFGQSNVKHNTDVTMKCENLARNYNINEFEKFSRIKGFLLRAK